MFVMSICSKISHPSSSMTTLHTLSHCEISSAMEAALKVSSVLSFHPATNSPRLHRTRIETTATFVSNGRHHALSVVSTMPDRRSVAVRVSTAASSEIIDPPEPAVEVPKGGEKYDWYGQWYPLMPVCDLDKRIPHAKRVMGIDVVVWWDRNEKEWKVFGDHCPHRLAPLSEGRIDQWGRLQCVYHGWCFNGSGDCKFIPQAPPDGPPVNTFKKACTSVYPSTVQNDMVWFWPNSDPQYKDILTKNKPPYIPEIDDPTYTKLFGNREINYGYELLIENLMDPAHVPYAHYGIMRVPKPKEKADREGGRPLDISLQNSDMNGFLARQDRGYSKFMAPCVFYFYSPPPGDDSFESVVPPGAKTERSSSVSKKRVLLIFICIPVSPGKSRLIWTFPRNFGLWIDRIVPRWVFHVGQNLVLDSDQYLLHVQEYKIKDIGPTNWQKSCFVPTKSDALVIAFRRWLNKYSNGEVNWRGKFSGGPLLPSPPREQLMDRYWTHVVNCSSCRVAYKGLNILEVALQVASVVSLSIVVAGARQNAMTVATRNILLIVAVMSFAASKWLAHFVHKTFRYHDYYHALR